MKRSKEIAAENRKNHNEERMKMKEPSKMNVQNVKILLTKIWRRKKQKRMLHQNSIHSQVVKVPYKQIYFYNLVDKSFAIDLLFTGVIWVVYHEQAFC